MATNPDTLTGQPAPTTIQSAPGTVLAAADYAPAAAFLAQYRRIWMSLHVSPDGDSLGSNLGLAHVLRQRGHDVSVLSPDPLPDNLVSFVQRDPGNPVIFGNTAPGPPPDAFVILDTSDLARLGTVATANASLFETRPVLNLDHHPTNLLFGTLNVVDSSAAAVSEQIPELVAAMGVTPDATAAQWLLLGLVTDTLGFRTSSTSARTMNTAARLMGLGANLYEIADAVFGTRPLAQVLLWSRALATVQTDGRTLWTTISREMLRETGAKEEEAEGIASFLSGVRTIQVSALLKERGDGTRVSLRSNPGVDVSAVARVFGGGGHKQAAGCTIPAIGEAAVQQLLGAVAQVLGPWDGKAGNATPPPPAPPPGAASA